MSFTTCSSLLAWTRFPDSRQKFPDLVVDLSSPVVIPAGYSPGSHARDGVVLQILRPGRDCGAGPGMPTVRTGGCLPWSLPLFFLNSGTHVGECSCSTHLRKKTVTCIQGVHQSRQCDVNHTAENLLVGCCTVFASDPGSVVLPNGKRLHLMVSVVLSILIRTCCGQICPCRHFTVSDN